MPTIHTSGTWSFEHLTPFNSAVISLKNIQKLTEVFTSSDHFIIHWQYQQVGLSEQEQSNLSIPSFADPNVWDTSKVKRILYDVPAFVGLITCHKELLPTQLDDAGTPFAWNLTIENPGIYISNRGHHFYTKVLHRWIRLHCVEPLKWYTEKGLGYQTWHYWRPGTQWYMEANITDGQKTEEYRLSQSPQETRMDQDDEECANEGWMAVHKLRDKEGIGYSPYSPKI